MSLFFNQTYPYFEQPRWRVFPPEIVYTILGMLHTDRETLSACTLVSRQFTFAASCCLGRQIPINIVCHLRECASFFTKCSALSLQARPFVGSRDHYQKANPLGRTLALFLFFLISDPSLSAPHFTSAIALFGESLDQTCHFPISYNIHCALPTLNLPRPLTTNSSSMSQPSPRMPPLMFSPSPVFSCNVNTADLARDTVTIPAASPVERLR
jgi:hypothetical protein